jgi:hypothetical protein
MLLLRRLIQALAAGGLAATLLAPAVASAAPISVNLRVEGSAKTLYEAPVNAEAVENPPGISTASSGGAHACDVKDNGLNEGFGVSAATPTAALYQAATSSGIAFDAKWSEGFHDFFITQVGPDVEGGAPEFASWGYAVNYTTAGVGGCQFQLAPGSEVLWAYNYFNLKHLLRLVGPTSANAGTPFTVHVSDGQTGEPLSGAAISELAEGTTIPLAGSLTGADGNATVTLSRAGMVTLKATRSDSVRSNGAAVCVHNGSDGTCGTSASGPVTPATTGSPPPRPLVPPLTVARIAGIKNGFVYPRRKGPRILRGVVEVPAGATLRNVLIRLERRYRGHCFRFSGSSVRFARGRCEKARFFSVGPSQSFSYLLPARLGSGRFVFEIEAIEGSGRVTKPVDGVSRVVFRVR